MAPTAYIHGTQSMTVQHYHCSIDLTVKRLTPVWQEIAKTATGYLYFTNLITKTYVINYLITKIRNWCHIYQSNYKNLKSTCLFIIAIFHKGHCHRIGGRINRMRLGGGICQEMLKYMNYVSNPTEVVQKVLTIFIPPFAFHLWPEKTLQ